MFQKQLLLVGSGYMGVEYAKVLNSMRIPFTTVSRGIKLAKEFEKKTGIKVITGGVDKYLTNNRGSHDIAIVAASSENLGSITLQLLNNGLKTILVEKPGGFNKNEVAKIAKISKKKKSKIFLGYNRRFYSSVFDAKKIISKDKGVTSFTFEFTEWGHIIRKLKKSSNLKRNWFLHNSTHVIDMAFFIGGTPNTLSTYTSGKLDWHPNAASFAGAGLTEKNIPFSYIANWDAPGRWSLEVMTNKHRLIFKPLEKLQIQKIGSIEKKFVKINDKFDTKFKPGLYKQVSSFINKKTNLCTIDQQLENIKIFEKILKHKL